MKRRQAKRLRLTGLRTGFTLLEVLVATVMFSILISALYSVFYGVIRLREKTSELVENSMPARIVTDLIKQDLELVVPPGGLLAGDFLGENSEETGQPFDNIEVYTASGTVTDSAPWSDIQKVQYYLDEPLEENTSDSNAVDLQGYDLVRSVTRNLLPTETEEPDEQRLLHQVESLDITYYDGQYWQESWDSTAQDGALPKAVKTHIEFVQLDDTNERPEPFIEIVCELVTEPKQSETSNVDTTEASGGGGSGQPGGGASGDRK